MGLGGVKLDIAGTLGGEGKEGKRKGI